MTELYRKKTVLVTGSNGQLGNEIKELASSLNQKNKFYFAEKNMLDISNEKNIKCFVETNKIDTIINCAAYTAVDMAESAIEVADLINHKAVMILAKISKEKDIRLIHISTDYVFDGMNHKPYIENDMPNPTNIYGLTKLRGELSIQKIHPLNSLIVRTSWVYSSYGENFVKAILRLGQERELLNIVYDQVGTPTYARDLAQIVLDMMEGSNIGLYHYSNEGISSWYDFAKEIISIKGFACKIKPIESKDYPRPAIRPFYSVLNKNKIKSDLSMEIPYWKDSLRECLEKIYKNKGV